MSVWEWILLGILVVLVIIILIRSANHSYTMGSNLFKNSDNNLEKDKKIDPSDYEYYNKKGKFK